MAGLNVASLDSINNAMEIAFDVSVAIRDHVFSGPSVCLLIVAKHDGGFFDQIAIAHLIKEIA